MRRVVLIMVIVGGLVVASCSGSDSDASGRATATSAGLVAQQVEVAYSYGSTGDEFVVDDPGEDGLSGHGTSRYTGDWTATSSYAYANQNQGSSFAGLSLGVLDGEVAGCGSGQFLLVVASIAGADQGGWLIAPGFGAGDLSSLGGSGDWTSTGAADGAADEGTIRGPVTCSGEPPSSEGSPFFGTASTGSVPVEVTATSDDPTIVWTQDLLSDAFGTAYLEGTWAGDATERLGTATSARSDGGFVEAKVMRFEGAVSGCGTGSVVVVALDRVDAEGSAGSRSWEIVPDFGTGDLVGATGFGTGTGRAADGTSTLTGSMSCGA